MTNKFLPLNEDFYCEFCNEKILTYEYLFTEITFVCHSHKEAEVLFVFRRSPNEWKINRVTFTNIVGLPYIIDHYKSDNTIFAFEYTQLPVFYTNIIQNITPANIKSKIQTYLTFQ